MINVYSLAFVRGLHTKQKIEKKIDKVYLSIILLKQFRGEQFDRVGDS